MNAHTQYETTYAQMFIALREDEKPPEPDMGPTTGEYHRKLRAEREVRDAAIVAFVTENPGCVREDIRTSLDLTKGQLDYSCVELRLAGLMRAVRGKGTSVYRYYAGAV